MLWKCIFVSDMVNLMVTLMLICFYYSMLLFSCSVVAAMKGSTTMVLCHLSSNVNAQFGFRNCGLV